MFLFHDLVGLKRTGKSCRLRWLNYLRPDLRRGNITPEEQLLIMELHAKWGNRLASCYDYCICIVLLIIYIYISRNKNIKYYNIYFPFPPCSSNQTMFESIAFISVDIGRRRRDSVPDLSAVLVIKESTVLKVPIRTDCSLSEHDEKDADSNVAGSALFI